MAGLARARPPRGCDRDDGSRTLAWDDSNNVFLVGLTGYNPPTWDVIGIVIYKSSEGITTMEDGLRSWTAMCTCPAARSG